MGVIAAAMLLIGLMLTIMRVAVANPYGSAPSASDAFGVLTDAVLLMGVGIGMRVAWLASVAPLVIVFSGAYMTSSSLSAFRQLWVHISPMAAALILGTLAAGYVMGRLIVHMTITARESE